MGRIERFTGEVEQGAVEETEAAAQTAAVEGDVYEDEYDEELFQHFSGAAQRRPVGLKAGSGSSVGRRRMPMRRWSSVRSG